MPAVYFLSGLTCTDDNVRVKAGAQRYAAELGLALVMPDTSPRGEDVADAPDRYDLGQGAGFYVNASRPPWAAHYRMFDYVNQELPALVERELPLIPGRRSITGHSMGGHGALISALQESRPLPLGIGLRAHLQPGGMRLGPGLLRRLSGRRSGEPGRSGTRPS